MRRPPRSTLFPYTPPFRPPPAGADLAAFEASGLAGAIERRGGTQLFVDFGDGFAPYASGFAVTNTLGRVDPALLEARGAGLIARGVRRPVAAAGRAASAIAGGDLSARLPVESADEFGAWAESFNRMAASLESSIADLQGGRDRERRFVADVSHELRTPLTALVGEASLLKEHLAAMPGEPGRLGGVRGADTD